jgi:hypothetical protein
MGIAPGTHLPTSNPQFHKKDKRKKRRNYTVSPLLKEVWERPSIIHSQKTMPMKTRKTLDFRTKKIPLNLKRNE